MKAERKDNSQIKRVMAILKVLCTVSQPIRLPELKTRLENMDIEESSDRTLKRDIALLKEELGYEIEGNARTGFYFQNCNEVLPLVFSREQLQALCLGRELFQPFNGTHFGDAIWEAYENIEKIYQRKAGRGNDSLRALEDAFIFHGGPRRDYKSKKAIIKSVFEAILNKQELSAVYQAPWRDESIDLTMHPHKLIVTADSFYLLAWNPDMDDFRLYLIDRVKSVKSTGNEFKARSISAFEEKFKYAFGISTEGEKVNLKVVFDKSYEPYISERLWHATQKTRQVQEGVELSMEVLDNAELITWLRGLRWKILRLAPASIKNQVFGDKS